MDRHRRRDQPAGVAFDPGGQRRPQLLPQDIDRGEAISSVLSLAQSVLPQLPPGTLAADRPALRPDGTTPVCLVALNSPAADEKTLYDVGRYQVRNQIMEIRGAVSPVVFGGKIRAVQIYLDREKMLARGRHAARRDEGGRELEYLHPHAARRSSATRTTS